MLLAVQPSDPHTRGGVVFRVVSVFVAKVFDFVVLIQARLPEHEIPDHPDVLKESD